MLRKSIFAAFFAIALSSAAVAQWPASWDGQFPQKVASAGDWLSNVSNSFLTTNAIWSAAKFKNLGTVSSGSITPNFCQYANAQVTLGATGLTMAAPTCSTEGQTFTLQLTEDNSGSRTITSWNAYYKFSGGTKPTLTTTGNAYDLLQCIVMTGATTASCSTIANPS